MEALSLFAGSIEAYGLQVAELCCWARAGAAPVVVWLLAHARRERARRRPPAEVAQQLAPRSLVHLVNESCQFEIMIRHPVAP